jgi:N-methylhydantoinase B
MAEAEVKNASQAGVDPVMLTLIQGALGNIQEEMTATLRRSGRSNVAAIARDYSNALFDAKSEMVLQGQDIPVHLGSLIFGLRGVVAEMGDNIKPGDVLYHNDPTFGGSHISDMCAYKPVFYEGELVFWAVSKLHVVDAGGPVAGSYNMEAKEIWGEGLRIPPIKLVDQGVMNEDILKMILLNIRTSENQAGDIRAQLGAIGVAERRLMELCEKYGIEELQKGTEALKALATTQMNNVIRDAEDGVGVATTTVEDTGHGLGDIEIKITAKVSGETLEIELESPPQIPHYINSYASNTISSVYLGLVMWAQLPPPYNEGLYKNVTVNPGPEGSLTNAKEPAPCMLSTSIPCENIAYATQKALAAIKPRRTIGEWGRSYIATITGIDPRNEEYFVNLLLATEISGAGATHGVGDGWNVIGPGNVLGATTSGDTELTELLYPIIVHEYSIRRDSGGAGKWRGGCGSNFTIEPLRELSIASFGQGVVWPSEGAEGAKDVLVAPKLAGSHVREADGTELEAAGNSMFTLRRGQRYVSSCPGGGGAGDPFERDPASVLDDIENHKVSVEGARVEYGVAVGDDGSIDTEGTAALRSASRADSKREEVANA